jgi:hypothetical protein
MVALLAIRTGAGGGAHEAQAGAARAHGWLQGEAPGHARQQEGEGGAGVARLPGLVRRRSWGRCVAREEVTGARRRPQGRR